jgi:RpiB/LacA/LacB family sugar-phosphate isomerase
MKILLASDHAGYALKKDLVDFLSSRGDKVEDLGTNSESPVDYPDFAEKLARAILQDDAARGILICGSGVGASVTANKFPGIRAGLCHDTYSAHQGVEHDNMNVLVLGSRIIGVELAKELVAHFLSAQFSGDPRHLRRLEKISAIEEQIGRRA